jgi:hypothetical protein
MPELPAFQAGEPIRDKVSHDIGHVELVRTDMVYVRWKHQPSPKLPLLQCRVNSTFTPVRTEADRTGPPGVNAGNLR